MVKTKMAKAKKAKKSSAKKKNSMAMSVSKKKNVCEFC